MLFSGSYFHLVDQKKTKKKKISLFQKVKSKKEKKVLHSFSYSFPFHFKFSPSLPLYNFPSFSVHFCSFPCLSFPGRLAKISRWKTSGGTLPPCLLRHCKRHRNVKTNDKKFRYALYIYHIIYKNLRQFSVHSIPGHSLMSGGIIDERRSTINNTHIKVKLIASNYQMLQNHHISGCDLLASVIDPNMMG